MATKIALFTKLTKVWEASNSAPSGGREIFAHYLIPPPSAAQALQVKVSADTRRRGQQRKYAG
ncbi:hypothetical protein [Klebsiella quasipneumoniae]|uniref:hypothetical protein n=1 Tax=Klebsiella quasipneumoniae TaxID=1463165 RepID=UPI001E50FBD0|nr:hypothetical protein [Klebsiella quasipneumoniae]MBR7419686.1 hypothetical protein [Klebsiella quasipneumoniae]MCD7074883.1 hypothetical protein [Klebsiella quasipneumoniae subsp. similipneumoniae]MCD7104139.1 hypothetical protein [Klebsiella quasipneumoniae subsp. similipneumoniae]MCR1230147.1 hypothetical protein [Klebsiella quasipneumoniae]MDG0656137.1 hypothetical protein [Klebsiella quasipneumoniae]